MVNRSRTPQRLYNGIKRIRKLKEKGSQGEASRHSLKIACENLDVTMIDAVEKKVNSWKNASGLNLAKSRLCTGGRGLRPKLSYRERFDVHGKSRGNLPVLLEYGLPL